MELIRKDKALKFMRFAMCQALEFSKDESTKVAAMVLGRNTYEIRTSGYNGMPRGCDDSKPCRLERPEKYSWMEHAERNAIYNAARVGTPLSGGILIVTLFPCMDCARAVVQAGIEGVVSVAPSGDVGNRWASNFEKSKELLAECQVGLQLLDPWELVSTAHPLQRAVTEWFFIHGQNGGQAS